MLKMEACDVLFIKKRKNASTFEKLASFLIRWATNSNYYHVIYYVSDSNVGFEANGFRGSGYTIIDDNLEYDVKRLNFTTEQREQVLNKIISYEGRKYDWGEILSLFLRKKLRLKIYYDNKNDFICSEELFSATYDVFGIHIIDQATGDVSPQDLWLSPYLVEVK